MAINLLVNNLIVILQCSDRLLSDFLRSLQRNYDEVTPYSCCTVVVPSAAGRRLTLCLCLFFFKKQHSQEEALVKNACEQLNASCLTEHVSKVSPPWDYVYWPPSLSPCSNEQQQVMISSARTTAL
jgi:hypothetical protein